MRSLILKTPALAIVCLLVATSLFDAPTIRQTAEQIARRTQEGSPRSPIAMRKIDRPFARPLPHSEKSQGVARLIAGLGQLLGLEIVAAGIESADELQLVRAAGCEVIQGYL